MTDTSTLSADLKRMYSRALLENARKDIVFSQFVGPFTPLTEEQIDRMFRNRLRQRRLALLREGFRKPSKGKPERLKPQDDCYD